MDLHTPPMNPSSTIPVMEFRRRYRSRARSHGTDGLYPSRECHVGFAAALDLTNEYNPISRYRTRMRPLRAMWVESSRVTVEGTKNGDRSSANLLAVANVFGF